MNNYIELKKLVEENEGLIYSIAKKFKGELDDLFQVGVIGLMKAYNNYNEKFNTKFTTYAYQYIYGEIYQYVLKNKNIKVSSETVKMNKAIGKATDFLTQKYGRKPNYFELSSFLEISIEKITENELIMDTIISLDDDSNEIDLYNLISSKENNKDDLIALRDALNKLNYEEKELILKRYFYNMTQSELAKELGVNQVKISREEGKVLTKLRQYM